MSTRYERMLEAISNGTQITEEPICRREVFLKALANKEGTSNLPEPICREEEFYRSIIAGEKITLEPICKKEEYLKAVANGETMPDSSGLSCREEKLLRNVCSKVVGGGSSTPTSFTVTFSNGVTVLNGSTKVTSGTKVVSGTSLTVSYTLSTGYHLSKFQINGVDKSNNITIIVGSNINIVFEEVKNTYQVTFGEGVTVLNGLTNIASGDSVEYGTELNISYTLTDGYELTTFQVNGEDAENNLIVVVTSNIDIVFEQTEISSGGGSAITFSRTFSENTPEVISQVSSEIASAGLTSAEVAEVYGWNIGDIITIPLTTGENIEMRIIGFNHDTLSDGTGTAGITLEMVNCLATKYQMNSSATNTGGWETSLIRTTTLPSLKTTLPTELQNVIKLIDKQSSNGSSTVVTTSDDLFLLCNNEIITSSNSSVYSKSKEGTQYEYYSDYVPTALERIKYYDTDGDGVSETAISWWTRSCYSRDSKSMCCIGSGGDENNYPYTNYSTGLSFAFCI